ncbi:hypothetical protein LINPERHAP2_LOCUS34381 [Linum perenne]
MVNMWAISRDPEFWSNPTEFHRARRRQRRRRIGDGVGSSAGAVRIG